MGQGAIIDWGDEHNYSYQAEMTFESWDLPPLVDAQISWSDLSIDLQGRPIEPGNIDQLTLIAFGLSEAELVDAITANSLLQSDVRDYRLLEVADGQDSAWLSDFGVLGNDFEPAQSFFASSDEWTWLVSAWDIERNGRDEILTSLHLNTVDKASPSVVSWTNTSATFEFFPDLQQARRLTVPEDRSALTLKWDRLTDPTTGNAIDSLSVDRLVLMHFNATIADLESDFMVELSNADSVYRSDVRGLTEWTLADSSDVDGEPFTGFSSSGLWVLGLECTGCISPIPVVMTVLEVVESADY